MSQQKPTSDTINTNTANTSMSANSNAPLNAKVSTSSNAPTLQDIITLLKEHDLLVKIRNITSETKAQVVLGASSDSRHASKGQLFICKGQSFKTSYLAAAYKTGICAALCEAQHVQNILEELPHVPLLEVSHIREAMNLVSPVAWDWPNRDLCVIGITGTKGKSTTTYMLQSILNARLNTANLPNQSRTANSSQSMAATINQSSWTQSSTRSCALIGSIMTYDGIEEFESINTTPEAPDLWRHLANAKKAGLKYVVMEVSSQALKYGRVSGLTFDIACFLNIGQDHISPVEHADFDDYFGSKLMIFNQAKTAVVNLQSDHVMQILQSAQACKKLVTYAVHQDSTNKPLTPQAASHDMLQPTIFATDIQNTGSSQVFTVHTPHGTDQIELSMIGSFNVSNALAAIAISELLGISALQIKQGLAHTSTPGRMELITCANPKVIALVDYAHNKLSFESFFEAVHKDFANKKIITVFGAAGGKAFERRHELPQVASKWADLIVYTNEDPGLEDPQNVVDELAAHTPAGQEYQVILDREKAITYATQRAFEMPEGAVVCLLAKGDETIMHVGNKFVPMKKDGDVFLSAASQLCQK